MSEQRASAAAPPSGVPELHPRIRKALTAQLERRRAQLDEGAESVGWKLSFDIPEVCELIGSSPVFGYLTSATLLASGSDYSAAGAGELRAETELALTIGHDGAAGMAVGLELNDVSRPPIDAESIVACNVFHRAVVLGAPVARAAPGKLEARLRVNGELRCAAAVDVDPDAVLRALAELLLEHSERLEPGDRVITGGVTHARIAAGDHVRAEIDWLGGVEVKITP